MSLIDDLHEVVKHEAYFFKCEAPWWAYVRDGIKTFEVRMHDPEKPVKEGDFIYLLETTQGELTGRELRAQVRFIFPLKRLDTFYTPPCARHYYMMECPLEVWGLYNVEVAEGANQA